MRQRGLPLRQLFDISPSPTTGSPSNVERPCTPLNTVERLKKNRRGQLRTATGEYGRVGSGLDHEPGFGGRARHSVRAGVRQFRRRRARSDAPYLAVHGEGRSSARPSIILYPQMDGQKSNFSPKNPTQSKPVQPCPTCIFHFFCVGTVPAVVEN